MRKTFAAGMAGGLLAFFGVAVLIAASTAWGDFIAIPRGTGAGLTGRVRWRELATNGAHSVDFKAPDSLSATTAYTLPNGLPAGNGYSLTSTIAGVTSWLDLSGSAGGGDACGGITACTVPPSTGWTWDNQGTSTIDSAADLEYMTAIGTGVGQLVMRYRTAPSTPYCVKMALLHDASTVPPGAGGGLDIGYGIGFRDSAAKIIAWYQLVPADGAIGPKIDRWTNSTTPVSSQFDGTYGAAAGVMFSRSPNWMGICDDATDLKYYWSIDGLHWRLMSSASRTEFFASGPNAYGFHGYAKIDVVVGLVSLVQTASGSL